MALIECPECKKEISDQAEHCLQCGYPIKETKEKEKTKEKKFDKATLVVPIISAFSLILSGFIGSRITADSNIEAARISVYNEIDKGTDLGSILYRERSYYVGTGEQNSVKAFPYSDRKGSTTLGSYTTDRFLIDCAVTNIYGNTWYRLDKSVHSFPDSMSGEGYIYSGSVIFAEDAAEIEWRENDIDGSRIPAGSSHVLNGAIISTNQLCTITAEIRQGNRQIVGPIREELEKVYEYKLNQLKINLPNASFFDGLEIGTDYRLILKIEYWTCGGTDIHSQEIVSKFDIVSPIP